MKKSVSSGILLMLVIVSGCIGTDFIEDVLIPPRVVISAKVDSLKVGESFQFVGEYYDSLGEEKPRQIAWQSSDANIISVDNTGLATALSEGDITITASVGNVMDVIMVNAGQVTSEVATERTGSFRGNFDYDVQGTFTLKEVDGSLVLEFSSNFTASRGPGLYIYLSNSQSSVGGGVELGKLKANSGEQSYDVPASVELNDYNHVLVYCKPFGVAFGVGTFND
ncbi:DM13 domain-containing protein [Fulvivirgaceae bacterium BMA10]|uniref:DM13 domain-containing protein n=1 Tax=Splendidivirga corallicola TaxID=3051826 RepID=A0ABT8KR31_9BACT|nr:DM13 domain-containing protein [Fulvivirgaceae bacterium BMA10]